MIVQFTEIQFGFQKNHFLQSKKSTLILIKLENQFQFGKNHLNNDRYRVIVHSYISDSGVYCTVFFTKMVEKKSKRLHLKLSSSDREYFEV